MFMKKSIILFILVLALLVLTPYSTLAATQPDGIALVPGDATPLNLVPPEPFGKTSPSDGAVDQSTSPTLSWGASAGADSYEYCYDTTNDNACSNWTDNGISTSTDLTGLTTGTTYYWHVRAINVDGTTYSDTGETAFWSFTTAFDPPGAFNKSSPSNGAANQSTSPTLSWDSSIGATSYEYCYDTTNDDTCSNWTSNGTATSTDLTGLSVGTTYYWHVKAINDGGTTFSNDADTAFWSFTTVPNPPGAFNKSSPSNGATGQSTSPTLSWGASAGADSYEYCYDTTNDNDCSNWTDNGASTSKSLTGLTTGTTYYWHIRAINAGGTTFSNASPTAFWSFTTVPNRPGAFNKSSPSNGAANQSVSPTLSWGASSGATSYDYCYDTTNDDVCSNWTGNNTATSKALSGLSPATTYYWHVRANNAGGTTHSNASPTAFWSFTTAPLPGAFNKMAPAAGAINQSTSPTLSWGASAGVTSYEYCYDTTNDNACTSWTSNGASTSKALSGLSTSTTYYWHIRAINAGGTTFSNASPTAFWSFTTVPNPPSAFNKTAPASGATNQPTSLNLTWGSSAGATSYEYCYDTTNDNDCTSWTNNGTSTSKALSNLNTGTTYYWHVRAINAGGTTYSNGGSPTAFWDFRTQGVAVGDSYEPDNTYPLAKLISSGVPQSHSIFPFTDVDWVKFQLTTPSAVTLETTGVAGHDTRMWLYNSSLVEIRFNDDKNVAVEDLYSYINTCDLAPLAAGTYYVKIDEYENNAEIPSYTLSFKTGTCVNVDIGGLSQGSYLVPNGGSMRQSFTGANNGPVKLASTNAAAIIGAERVIYKVNGVNTSFTEMMGLPESQLDNVYWLPWYNNVDLDTQVRIANVSTTTATVRLYVGGVEKISGCTPSNSPYTLAAGVSIRVSCAGVNNGPVKIESNVNIVAAERVIYKVNGVNTSFSEMMGLPDNQLDTIYWLPWYNNVDLDTQLRIANVTNLPGTVRVYIGGVEAMGSPFDLPAGASIRRSFHGVNSGPVKIESNVDIVAAERVIYKINGLNTSFTEMMALPNSQLNTTFWLPWYNNVDLDTQLRFANVGSLPTTVHIYIGGVEVLGSPFEMPAGVSTRKTFAGVNKGPVQIVSDQPIVAAERVIYKVNNINTSFSEMMGLPASLLDDVYWLPWYNNVDLDTQLRFGRP